MNPTSISGREGWGDGEMGAQMGKYGRNKPKKKEVTDFIEILGFPDSEMFLPRPALFVSVSFFFVLGKKKALNIGQECDNMTFKRQVLLLDEYLHTCMYLLGELHVNLYIEVYKESQGGR